MNKKYVLEFFVLFILGEVGTVGDSAVIVVCDELLKRIQWPVRLCSKHSQNDY